MQACKHVPCSTVWEQVGIKYFKTGVYDKADMALAQANVMDPKNPSAWAWMAAVQLSQEQQQEAETCLR